MKRALLLTILSFLLPFAAAHASCTASHVCGDGNTATCSGTSTCSVTIAGVSCDGIETKCPNYCSASEACTMIVLVRASAVSRGLGSSPVVASSPVACG